MTEQERTFILNNDEAGPAARLPDDAETEQSLSADESGDGSGILKLDVSAEDSGARLDAFIGWNTDELSRSYAVKLIEKGRVSINGKTVISKKSAVAEGDIVRISLPEPEKLDVIPENIPIEIVYEDEDLLVVNKPRGMVVHPGPGNWSGTLVNAIMYHCGNSLSTINVVIRPGIVHRIDKDTSGLLMIAKNDMAHESLASQLRVHSVTREYTALCYDNIGETGTFGVSGVTRSSEPGVFGEDDSIAGSGGVITIDIPIGRDDRNRMRRAVYGSAAREAVTHVKVSERFGKYTLIKARLETGRTHQIRVHMAYIHHPLVGDELYGPRKQAAALEGVRVSGQLLHAGILGFIHPGTGSYMEFHADLPEMFAEIIDRLRQDK